MTVTWFYYAIMVILFFPTRIMFEVGKPGKQVSLDCKICNSESNDLGYADPKE